MDTYVELGTWHHEIGRADIPFGISLNDLERHLWIIGGSGMGKSALLRRLAIEHIHAGHGFAFFDPHGDEIEALIDHIPPERFDDVVLIDPSDTTCAVGLNPLFGVPEHDRPKVAENLVLVFARIWGDGFRERSQDILRNALRSLLDCPTILSPTFLGLLRLLRDEEYRKAVVRHSKDPEVRRFWEDDFGRWNERFRSEVIQPLQNKFRALLEQPSFTATFGQYHRKFDPRYAMDHGKIVFVKLSKGGLGEEPSRLIGAILFTMFQQAAFSREDIPKEERRRFDVLIDEFSSFTTSAMASFLSECRKYGTYATLANQYVRQVPDEVMDAVVANCANTIAFRVSEFDLPVLVPRFEPELTRTTLLNLGRGQVAFKVLRDGIPDESRIGQLYMPPEASYGRSETVRQWSNQRYATPLPQVAANFEHWSSNMSDIA